MINPKVFIRGLGAMMRLLLSWRICFHDSVNDAQLGRFWQNRGSDGMRREKQLLVDFLCASAGGPLYYTGRDMALSHKGMKISGSDWTAFIRHVNATLDTFKVPQQERNEVLVFIESTKPDIVEV